MIYIFNRCFKKTELHINAPKQTLENSLERFPKKPNLATKYQKCKLLVT